MSGLEVLVIHEAVPAARKNEILIPRPGREASPPEEFCSQPFGQWNIGFTFLCLGPWSELALVDCLFNTLCVAAVLEQFETAPTNPNSSPGRTAVPEPTFIANLSRSVCAASITD